MIRRCTLALGAVLFMNLALADDSHIGTIQINHAHARPTVPGQLSGAAYLSIENKGSHSDKLLTVSSPIAASAEVHNTIMDGNIMRMREVSELEVQSSARVVMAPGDGYHIMLVGLKKALVPGEKIPLSLRFEKAGKLEIEAVVDNR
ncbi:MAG TPA: copper chaperone PCu(A)C [Burkholderiaceae bacterium]|nr:copper chaperone PCu(A)C [Burkholderiaceae bacterium]